MRTHLSSFFKSPAIRRWTLFTLVLTPLLATLAATQPSWWSSGDHAILSTNPANNLGTANLGQAKHVAASAIAALREVAPVVAGNIEADLAGTVDLTVPNPKTPEWLAQQQGALVLGQLKALATPFYDRLHSVAPEWLEQQRVAAGSQQSGTHLPWTPDTTDDANTSPANIGQLKAVFALDFSTLPAASLDSDGDDMPDAWEIANGLNPRDPADANDDPDNDGLTNAQEHAIEGNPNVADNPGIVQDGIRNGDFTEPAILGGGLETTHGATGWNYWAGIPGWTAVEGENIELQNLEPDGSGNPYVELKAHPAGHYGIKQTVGTRKGINYLVIFRCKPRGDVPAYNSNMEVKVNGTSIKSVTFMDDLEWQTYVATFQADRVISELSFVPSITPEDTLGCLVDGVSIVPVEVVELTPKVKDEAGKEIENSEKPVAFPKYNELVEEIKLKNQFDENRIAHREIKVKISGGKILGGKRLTWTMQAWGVKEADAVRGDWNHSKVEEHKNRFEESKTYGKYGHMLIDQKSSETKIETMGDDGFTAIRVNLPPIGWNHAEVKMPRQQNLCEQGGSGRSPRL